MTLLVIAGMVAAMAVVALLWLKAEPARSATAVPKGFTDTLIAQVNKPTAMAVAPVTILGRSFLSGRWGCASRTVWTYFRAPLLGCS